MAQTTQKDAQLPSMTMLLRFQNLHLQMVASPSPTFSVERIPPFTCTTAVLVVEKGSASEEAADSAAPQQQSAPLGTQTAGHVQLRMRERSSPDATITIKSPLYQAWVGYRQPTNDKDGPSLSIVEKKASGGGKRKGCNFRPTSVYGGPSPEERAEVRQVCFVDLTSTTGENSSMLRCTKTKKLIAPLPLYCSFPTNSDAATETSDQAWPAKAAISGGGGITHAQHTRRRVVMLPLSAAGETYELVSISLKRARDIERGG